MFNKIKNGFLNGLGFGIGLLLVYSFYMMLILPTEIKLTMEKFNESNSFYSGNTIDDIDVKIRETSSYQSKHTTERQEKPKNFYQLSVDEKIEMASAIAIGKFQDAEEGLQKAVISEFLKKDPDLEIYYDIGDELPFMSSYQIKSFDKSGLNFIVFFTGNPPIMKSGMTYEGERIRGLNDIPIKLLREKCNLPTSSNSTN